MLLSQWERSSLEVLSWERWSEVLGWIRLTDRMFLQLRLGSFCFLNSWPRVRFKNLFHPYPVKILDLPSLLFSYTFLTTEQNWGTWIREKERKENEQVPLTWQVKCSKEEKNTTSLKHIWCMVFETLKKKDTSKEPQLWFLKVSKLHVGWLGWWCLTSCVWLCKREGERSTGWGCKLVSKIESKSGMYLAHQTWPSQGKGGAVARLVGLLPSLMYGLIPELSTKVRWILLREIFRVYTRGSGWLFPLERQSLSLSQEGGLNANNRWIGTMNYPYC